MRRAGNTLSGGRYVHHYNIMEEGRMSIHNLKNYKESLILLPDVEDILKVLTLTEKALTHYKHYIPAAKVLFTVKDQKAILEGYKKELTNTKISKGLKQV